MIEIKSLTHSVRYLATKTRWMDVFRVVRYVGYRGDINHVPWFFKRAKSNSCSTDLRMSMDEVLASMKSNSRNEIRRAEREGCEFSVSEDVGQFINFYNDFCKSKGLNDAVTRRRLSGYPKLLITQVTHGGIVLAMHANVLDYGGKQALLLFSCSQRFDVSVDKKLIGWGNRYLHYKDLEYLKGVGMEYYDWSGVVLDPSDPRFPIGQFKLSLGGRVIECYTLRSPLFYLLEKLREVVA